MLNLDVQSKICGACCIISTVTLVIMIFSSFASLEVNEYGLDYSYISKSIGKKAYPGGIHFLGVGHSFIKYPKTVLNLDYSNHEGADYPPLKSRTSDGLEVILEISFQYKLEYESLYDLFHLYKDNYSKIFSSIAVNTLTQTATYYTAYNFFVDIQKIGVKMQEELNDVFKKNCFASIEFFQLRSVDLPNQFEEAIQVSEVKKQQIQLAQAEKSRTIVELETLKMSASFQKNVTINYALGDAQAIEMNGKAQSISMKNVQNVNTQQYKKLKKQLKLNNNQLLTYIKSKVVREYNGKGLAIALESPDKNQNIQK
ncbi:hypothetical protein ABPG72_003242 [Tetrahymena utriculariae]